MRRAGGQAVARLQPVPDPRARAPGRPAGGAQLRRHRVRLQFGCGGDRGLHQDGPALSTGRAATPERHRIITFEGAFHGRTMAGISAAGGKKMVEGFDPLLPGFDIVPFGDQEALHAAIGTATAAIMIEPIQGEGGIRAGAAAVPAGAARAVRRARPPAGLRRDPGRHGPHRHAARLRAGRASRPTSRRIAKGLGGGFPIGACLATARAASGMTAGTHGSTFGGNPLACAVANAVLDVMLADGFLEQVVARAAGSCTQRLEAIAGRIPDGDRRGARPGPAGRASACIAAAPSSSRRCTAWVWSPCRPPTRSCACCRR